MKIERRILIGDAIIVLLNLAAGSGNILKNWLLFTSNSLIFPLFVILFDILYLLAKINKYSFRHVHKRKFLLPYIIYVVILLYCFLNSLFCEGRINLSSLEPMLLAFLMLFVLNIQVSYIKHRIPDFRNRVKYLSRGYIWLAMFSVIGVISSFIFYRLNLVGDTPITADFLTSNEDTGISYSRVFLSVHFSYGYFSNLNIRVPFFQDDGVFSGLFHEGQLLAYNVFPCLILLLGLFTSKMQRLIIIFTSILMMFFSGSATNVLVLLFCLSVFFFIVGKKNFIMMIVGIFIVIFAIVVYISLDDTFMLFILDRLDGSNVSNQTSQSLLKFAFSPKSFWGGKILSTAFIVNGLKQGEDVGYIAFSLNIIFLFFFLLNTLKLILKSDSFAVATGFASLYCILHSAKFGITMYLQYLIVFLIFLQSYILSSYGRIDSAKKDQTTRG